MPSFGRIIIRRTRIAAAAVAYAVLASAAVTHLHAQEPLVRLTGTIHDSTIRRGPLIGADVVLESLGRTARTDSLGQFVFDSVPEGEYAVAFAHPRFDSLGLSLPPARVRVASGDAPVFIHTPSATLLFQRFCGRAPDKAEGMLVGMVRAVSDGRTLSNAQVTARWNVQTITVGKGASLREETATRTVQSGEDGRYVLCGVPTDIPLEVAAEHTSGALTAGPIVVVFPGPRIAVQELAVATRDTTRIITVRGRVVQPDGGPIAEALVVRIGGDERTVASADGRFQLRVPSAGSWTIEARGIGFARARRTVVARATGAEDVTMTLQPTAAQLDELVAIGDPTGYEQRRRNLQYGTFISAAQIQKLNPDRVLDAVRVFSGAIATNGLALPQLLLLKGGRCVPRVFIDGRELGVGLQMPVVSPAEAIVNDLRGAEVPTRTVRSPMGELPDDAARVEGWWREQLYKEPLRLSPANVRGIEVYDASRGLPSDLRTKFFQSAFNPQLGPPGCAVFIWTWYSVPALTDAAETES